MVSGCPSLPSTRRKPRNLQCFRFPSFPPNDALRVAKHVFYSVSCDRGVRAPTRQTMPHASQTTCFIMFRATENHVICNGFGVPPSLSYLPFDAPKTTYFAQVSAVPPPFSFSVSTFRKNTYFALVSACNFSFPSTRRKARILHYFR